MEALKAKSLLTENLNFTSEDIEKIELFNILLLEYNKRYNLISKSSESVIWERHVLDSAQITKFIDFKEFGSLSDLGTGGGFPGIILSIYNKNLKFHVKLYEKSVVKADFLQKIKQKLELKFELINSDIYKIKIASNYIVCRAFKKLPENEDEMADVIKIANGRWPNKRNQDAENEAESHFQKIYKKVPDMKDSSDNAAITVMAYGLRQKAENRNLDSERQGIKIFMDIYGYHPDSTEDWNVMQAITYSGSKRGIDTDKDLLIDEREVELGTDPNNPDTDGDGHLDGVEVANGFDPLNK